MDERKDKRGSFAFPSAVVFPRCPFLPWRGRAVALSGDPGCEPHLSSVLPTTMALDASGGCPRAVMDAGYCQPQRGESGESVRMDFLTLGCVRRFDPAGVGYGMIRLKQFGRKCRIAV